MTFFIFIGEVTGEVDGSHYLTKLLTRDSMQMCSVLCVLNSVLATWSSGLL